MKRGLLWATLLGLYLCIALVSAVTNVTCEDTEKSIKYDVQGTTKGNWFKDVKKIVEYTDVCVVEGGKIISEYFCDEGVVATLNYNCPVACENGACVKELSPPQICEDSDANNVNKKGSVSAKTFNSSWGAPFIILNATTSKSDYCANISAPAENLGECNGGDCGIIEFTCIESGRNNIGQMTPSSCQFGCKDGACLKEAQEAPKPVEVKPAPQCEVSVRNETKYCNAEKQWSTQKALKATCANNYECATNLCSESICAEPPKSGFFAGIWNWIKGLFGN